MKTSDHHYYINGGLFQGYMYRELTKKRYSIDPIDKQIEKRKEFKTTWWGQTCDSYDFIRKDVMEPTYKTGEWVVSRNHGLYHTSITCNFNGFKTPENFY